MYINPSFGKVGNRLKQIRKNYDWTLQESCDKVKEISEKLSIENPTFKAVKLNPSHLSKIENNEVDTSDYYIALLCEAYEIKMSDLYKEDENFQQELSKGLIHLPPHIREFVNNPDNFYLINTAYNMSKFNQTDINVIREFLKTINI